MQSINPVNDILKSISRLPEDEQFFIVDILNKRINELKRTRLVLRAKEAEDNYKAGKYTSGSVSDLMGIVSND